MAVDNQGIFGGNTYMDSNQRIAVNNAQIQRNNAQINNLGGNMGYMPSSGYSTNGFMNGGFGNQYPQQSQFLKCRPVTSIEEARAAQIDLDGSLWVFIDTGNDKIYTKQIRNDGASAFRVYTYTEEAPVNNNYNFVTKEEMNSTVQEAVQYILNLFPKAETQQNEAVAANQKSDKSTVLKF